MAIYYKGKKVASNRNVNHKDFVDCRDVEFTNPQDGDVPTWDSTAQKLVNKPAHGVFELWVNPHPDEVFAGQSIEISSDIQYDAFIIVTGAVALQAIAPTWHEMETSISSFNLRDFYLSLGSGAYATMSTMTRSISQSYNSTTHKYTITFGDCTMVQQVANTNTATTTTSNGSLSPMRILGIIHND